MRRVSTSSTALLLCSVPSVHSDGVVRFADSPCPPFVEGSQHDGAVGGATVNEGSYHAASSRKAEIAEILPTLDEALANPRRSGRLIATYPTLQAGRE